MSHVDDGELTAYADGAYPVNDPVALRISAHLSTCGNCRTRLEQNQDLRARASEILAYATPAVRETPAFETLQTRMVTSSPARRRTFPLAWAATIIMALGLGWFGRGLLQDPTAGNVAMQEMQTAAPAVDAVAPSTTQTPPAAEAARDLGTQLRQADVMSRRAGTEEAADRATLGGIAGNAAAGSVAAPEIATLNTTGAGAQNVSAPPPSAPVPAPLALAAREAAAQQVMTAAEAERREMDLPRIPELPIERVVVTAEATTVEQRLPDGKIISLVVTAPRPMRAEADQAEARKSTQQRSLAPSAPNPNVVVSARGNIVTVVGELPRDSLRALGAKVR